MRRFEVMSECSCTAPPALSGTLPREASAREIAQVILSMWYGFEERLAIGFSVRKGYGKMLSKLMFLLSKEIL